MACRSNVWLCGADLGLFMRRKLACIVLRRVKHRSVTLRRPWRYSRNTWYAGGHEEDVRGMLGADAGDGSV